MENTEQTAEVVKTKTVSVELTLEQYAFLTGWQKTHEQELGIEVPVGAMVRKAVDMAMKSAARKEDDRPSRPMGRPMGRPSSDRPAGRSFDKPMGRSSDRGDFKSGPRKSFGGDRPSRGGPKFDMLGPRSKTKSF